MNIHIREERLPGIGVRYEISLEGERDLTVVAQRDGRHWIAVTAGSKDEPEMELSLSPEQSVALAALLIGARLSTETMAAAGATAGETVVDTVTLPSQSPAVGKTIKDISLPDEEQATVLAVIRDETPELVEDEETEKCRAGDRVVVIARRERLEHVVRQLTG